MRKLPAELLDLSDDELWLLQEELAELGETDIDLEEAYRELAAAIAGGKPLRTSTTTLYEGEDHEESNVQSE